MPGVGVGPLVAADTPATKLSSPLRGEYIVSRNLLMERFEIRIAPVSLTESRLAPARRPMRSKIEYRRSRSSVAVFPHRTSCWVAARIPGLSEGVRSERDGDFRRAAPRHRCLGRAARRSRRGPRRNRRCCWTSATTDARSSQGCCVIQGAGAARLFFWRPPEFCRLCDLKRNVDWAFASCHQRGLTLT